MRYRKQLACIFLVSLCLCLSGCSKLYVMTDDEEDQVVLYAAKMISKFNRGQNIGYSYVSEEKKADDTAETKTAENSTETTDAQEAPDAVTYVTLTDAIGVDGVTFDYEGYDIATSFETDDVAIPDASEGKSYLLVHVAVTNITDQAMAVDLINNSVTYQVKINDETTVSSLTTLSMADLSTYYNKSLAAGATQEASLIFEVDDSVLETMEHAVLLVTRSGQTSNVEL